ncbi:MAG: FAD-dependent oxidoreductase [Elusimicrobia bacterium]|nr:FAD-dependent oxidoreductase [Elusimicrobiota bacterium]
MVERSDVLVLGGGVAGLACATALAEAGFKVAVAEKRSHLGGRARSFRDPETGDTLDNGLHLFLGCYRQADRFLRRIGQDALVRFPEDLRVGFFDGDGRRDVLRCPAWLGTKLGLAWGVLGLSGVGPAGKLGLLRLGGALNNPGGPDLDAMTVRQWLDRRGLTSGAQGRVLEPLTRAVLNESPDKAAATGLAQVLREMLAGGPEASRVGLSAVGLSELYAEPARSYLESRGGSVLLSTEVTGLLEEGGRVSGAVDVSGSRLPADTVVSTLPPWELAALELPGRLRGSWEGLRGAAVVSITLWLDRPVLDEPLAGLLGTTVHWAFDRGLVEPAGGAPARPHGRPLTLVVSGASDIQDVSPAGFLEAAKRDLAACFPGFRKARITAWKVSKEPRATLSPVPGAEERRPRPGLAMPGFSFAGDWTRTGLPATIESAAASGHRAAEELIRRHAEIG